MYPLRLPVQINAIRDIYRGIKGKAGLRTTFGEVVLDEEGRPVSLTGKEAFMMALGFKPMRVQKVFDMRALEREIQRRRNEILRKFGTSFSKAETAEDKAAAALEVSIARDELYQWNQRLNAPLANTCEQMADDARLEFLTSRIIVNENGDKVWDSFDSYLTEKEQSLANQARFEVMLYLQGLDSDFLEKTPEAIAMKELDVLASVSKDTDEKVKSKSTNKKKSRKTNNKKKSK